MITTGAARFFYVRLKGRGSCKSGPAPQIGLLSKRREKSGKSGLSEMQIPGQSVKYRSPAGAAAGTTPVHFIREPSVANILTRMFGSRNQRLLRQMSKVVRRINALEEDVKALSDADIRNKTDEFRERFAGGESLEDLLPEAFAVAREAAWRALGLRPFDVQLIGGMVLHQGNIAEMRTGEGKTLVATLPAYLNALSGKGVHIVTVNEYLAQRERGLDGPDIRVSRFDGGRLEKRPVAGREEVGLRMRHYPMRPTTNSASTTCVTIWLFRCRTKCSES